VFEPSAQNAYPTPVKEALVRQLKESAHEQSTFLVEMASKLGIDAPEESQSMTEFLEQELRQERQDRIAAEATAEFLKNYAYQNRNRVVETATTEPVTVEESTSNDGTTLDIILRKAKQAVDYLTKENERLVDALNSKSQDERNETSTINRDNSLLKEELDEQREKVFILEQNLQTLQEEKERMSFDYKVRAIAENSGVTLTELTNIAGSSKDLEFIQELADRLAQTKRSRDLPDFASSRPSVVYEAVESDSDTNTVNLLKRLRG
jgi:hypothetical protein